MQIQGKEIAEGQTENWVETLESLPGAFSFRAIRKTDVSLGKMSDAGMHKQAAQDAFTAWQTNPNPNPAHLEEAFEFAEKAAAAAHKDGKFGAEGACLQMLAAFASQADQPERMVEALRRARAIHQEHGHSDRLIPVLGGLYDGLIRLNKKGDSSPELQAEIDGVLAEATDLWPRRQNEPVREDAVRVEQGEVGFSADTPIGTDNVCDCLAIAVRDPITKKTALAHVDGTTTPNGLNAIFERLPKPGPNDPPLQVRLIGARLPDNPISKRNIRKVMDFLQDKPVNILSADVMDSKKPSTFVVDPASFEVKEAFPGAPNPDRFIANGIKLITNSHDNSQLRVAFDLTSSPERAPVLATGRQAQQIARAFVDQTNLTMHRHFAHMLDGISLRLPSEVEMSKQLGQAYETAYAPIRAAFDAKLDAFEAAGNRLTDTIRERSLGTLNELGIHLGANARAANQPLLDFLENDFLENGQDLGGAVSALRKFSFPAQPITALEQAAPRSFQSRLAAESSRSRDGGLSR